MKKYIGVWFFEKTPVAVNTTTNYPIITFLEITRIVKTLALQPNDFEQELDGWVGMMNYDRIKLPVKEIRKL